MSETTTGTAPMSCFEQLAVLQGLVAQLFGSVVSYNDPAQPGAPVVYVESPVGQLVFRPAEADMHYFDGLRVVADYPWDRVTGQQTYRRIVELTKLVPPGVLTYATPRLEAP